MYTVNVTRFVQAEQVEENTHINLLKMW